MPLQIRQSKLKMMASELGSSENSDLLTGSIRNHSSSLAPKKDDGREEVRERHAQLKEYINILDKKMHKIVQHNEAEIMFAYKNHLTRVKREMQEIKERAKANSSNVSNQLEKIELLEKQLIVFREEALRLFEKIAEKDKIIEEMTIRLSELTNEKKYMDENVKMLLKKNKQLESRTFELTEVQSDSVNFEPLQSHYVSLVRPSTSSNIKCISRNGIKDTLCSDLADLCVKVRAKLTHFAPIRLEQVLRAIEQSYHKKEETSKQHHTFYSKISTQPKHNHMSLRTKSNFTSDFSRERQSKPQNYRVKGFSRSVLQEAQEEAHMSEMLQFFATSVETVKKQILRRSLMKHKPTRQSTHISLEQFRKLDFFRLLELVLANNKVIECLYKQLFGAMSVPSEAQS